jgi:hypothetical protein
MALFLSGWPLSYAAAQHLRCNPCDHGYGRVQIGDSKQYIFQLTNTGNRTLRILSKRKNNKAFLFGNFPLPVTLRPGKSAQLTIKFKPLAAGKTTGTITLISNALNTKLTLSVWGTGAVQSPALGVSPSTLHFGNVVVGSHASLRLTLSASKGSVTISSARVNSSEFTLPGLRLPLTIAAGQNVQVAVRFSPNASGRASGKLTLSSNADNSPNTVPLTGVGVAAKAHSTALSWDPSKAVIGYNVYRGRTKGENNKKINPVLEASTNYTDRTVMAGATYYYVVTAVDAEERESSYSNEVRVVIPSP